MWCGALAYHSMLGFFLWTVQNHYRALGCSAHSEERERLRCIAPHAGPFQVANKALSTGTFSQVAFRTWMSDAAFMSFDIILMVSATRNETKVGAY